MPEEWLNVFGMLLGGGLLLAGLALDLRERLNVAVPDRTEPVSDRLISAPQLETENSLRVDLARAGFPQASAETIFGLLKLGSGLAGLGGAMALTASVAMLSELLLPARLGLLVVGFGVGYLLPVKLLQQRVRAYRVRIDRAVPDALDLMQICVDAGQSLDQAFLRIARELAPVHPELASHFAWSSEAIAAGLERQEALLKIAQETGNEDLRLLAMTVVQAAKLGTPISRTLRVFGDDLRDRHVRKIEERTSVLPTKMTLGTMFFTVPPLLILLLTPAIVRIAEMM